LACRTSRNPLLPRASASRERAFAAAYLYGQAANALDYDDTLDGHPGSPIIGAMLAIGADKGLSVDRLLRGIAAGYEVHSVLSSAASPSNERAAQVRSIGVFDTVAASVGALVALGADEGTIERAIGVALPHSILPYVGKWYERPVPAMKNNMGWIAAGAVLSVNLVIEGQTGITRALEGETGMWRMAGSDRWALDEHLSRKPAVLRTGFKHYPSCWHTQEHLRVLAKLLESVDAEDEIGEIVVAGPADLEKFCDKTLIGAADIAFSFPALFDRLIAGIEPGPLWEHLDHPEAGYDFRYEPSDRRTLTIRTRQGREFSASVILSDHSNLAPSGLDEAGVIAKFDRLTDAAVHAETLPLLDADCGAAADQVPERFYRAVADALSLGIAA
jgi:hypothetical protein